MNNLVGIFNLYKEERSKLKHPAWIIAAIVVAYFVIGAMATMIGPQNPNDDQQAMLAIMNTGITLLIFLFGAKILGKHSFEALGFKKVGGIKTYVKGMITGFIAFSSVVLITVVFGMQHLTSNKVTMSTLALFFIMFIVQGASEEIMFRSVIFPEIASRFGLLIGLIGSSILFALIHAGSSTMGVVNMFFFGLMMALAYYWLENILFTSGLHMMWNFAEGNIFGIAVSGHAIENAAICKSTFTGNTLINGGTGFGSEAGLICTFVLIVACIIFAMLVKNKKG